MYNPTFDPQTGGKPLAATPDIELSDAERRDIVSVLQGYKAEAVQARQGGPHGRDEKWRENLDLYWNRFDFSRKAIWQAKEVLPEVPGFVDRFASALKEALMSAQGRFYSIVDPADKENDLTQAVQSLNDMWLSQVGQNQNGNILPFESVFEEQMKLGALMATSSVVTWKNDVKDGRVAIETEDPRHIYLDPTYRNLYRIRQIEIDKHELLDMIKQKDSKGSPIFNIDELENLVTGIAVQETAKREELAGHGVQTSTPRQPIVLDEYIATVVDQQGKRVHDKALFVVANDQHLIRGPEANPFWHGKDWLVFAPLITVPLSVYGRSYMEDFGSIAKTFNTLTNLILDATYTASLKAWAVVPGMLTNPAQLAEGMTPNKMFLLEDGLDARMFANALEMGTLPPEVLAVWERLKNELTEAAQINEIGMGQFAPKGRTSATEVMSTQQSSSSMIRSIANTVETRWMNPTLDLGWKTGLQHMKPNSEAVINAVGAEMALALYTRRKELIKRPITFQARGLSEMIQRSQALKTILGVLQIIGSNQLLATEFMKKVSMERLVDLILRLSNIDMTKLQMSDRDKMVRNITEPLQQLQQQGAGTDPAGPGAKEMGAVTKAMGVGA